MGTEYHAVISSPLSEAETFRYLADFTNARDWDPGVLSASRLDAGLIGAGTRFRLTVGLLGLRIPLTYRITWYKPPAGVVFEARSLLLSSRDQIDITRREPGSTISYLAQVGLRGPLRIFEPLLARGFQKVAVNAVAGLSGNLAGIASGAGAQRE